MIFWAGHLQAQFECNDPLYVSLPPNGTFTLIPEDLLSSGDLTGYTTTLSQSIFTCDDLGSNNVTLQIFENQALVFECTSTVIVEDKVNPIAQCVSSLDVELNVDSYYFFNFDELDNGSYDVCSPITYTFVPPFIDCSSSNPTIVTMVVTDASGNSSSCDVTVHWSPYPNPTMNLACNAQITVTVDASDAVEITPDMVLEGGPYGCPFQYEVEVRENNIPRPEPVVTLADTNKTLFYFVTDLNTGVMCWGEILVESEGDCGLPFFICDTECHSAPEGDCASGHNLADNVEWPCDLTIPSNCELPDISYTPEYLVEAGLATEQDASPAVFNEACYQTSSAYYDIITYHPGAVIIERNWAIILWSTGDVWEYVQYLTVAGELATICDTLPWNAPAGDCASGHTLTDDVEWPADITISSVCYYPEDLAMNEDVNPNDVQPALLTDCTPLYATYSDVITVIDANTLHIDRSWTVLAAVTGQTWTYVQEITVITNTNASTVCVMRENGEPIPGVELIPGVITDNTGCYTFDNPAGIIVTPVKDSPLQSGVNLLDKILILEYLLGITELSPYQQYAADLSQSSAITALDVVMMNQLLDGTLNPVFDHNWKFFERSTMSHSADISDPLHPHKFIGVKMGDIDNSYPLDGSEPLQQINLSITDEILNKKEVYEIPFLLTKNERVTGFAIKIEGIDSDIHFLNVSAPVLPGFSMEDNVVIGPGSVTINYIIPTELLQYGVTLQSGTPLFTLKMQPQENGILSESIALAESNDNLLKPTDEEDALEFKFTWDKVIVSGVFNPGSALPLSFYPNPVRDEIHFNGFEPHAKGTVSIVDASGRVMASTPLIPTWNISTLHEGMYYLRVGLESGETYSAPMIKLNP